MENYLFWSEAVEEGQDLKSRAAHHHQAFPGVPPPPPHPGHLQRNFRLVDTRHEKKQLISTWRSVIQLVIKHNANEQTSQILGGVDSRWDTYVAKFEGLSWDEN